MKHVFDAIKDDHNVLHAPRLRFANIAVCGAGGVKVVQPADYASRFCPKCVRATTDGNGARDWPNIRAAA